MTNYYTHATAEGGVKTTRFEHDQLVALLEVRDGEAFHGFTLERWDATGQSYLLAEENGVPDALPERFLRKFGEAIAMDARKHLQIGLAFTCDKLRPDSHGGEYIRVMPDGRRGRVPREDAGRFAPASAVQVLQR